MTIYYFRLFLTEKEWLRYYRGEASAVLVTTTSGKTVSLAARHFRRFTTKSGIQGFFKLTLSNNRFVSLEQIR